jgi:hypothetical protein
LDKYRSQKSSDKLPSARLPSAAARSERSDSSERSEQKLSGRRRGKKKFTPVTPDTSATDSFIASMQQKKVQENSNSEAPPVVRPARSARTKRTKAKFSFVGEHEDELCMDEGDDILILKNLDQGWTDGMNLKTRKRGIFPTSYVL